MNEESKDKEISKEVEKKNSTLLEALKPLENPFSEAEIVKKATAINELYKIVHGIV